VTSTAKILVVATLADSSTTELELSNCIELEIDRREQG
jgi:hypothetical protein